jgi:hypothetical protein
MERKITFAILAIVAAVGLAVSAVALASISFSTTAFAQGNTMPGPHQKDTRCGGPQSGSDFRGTGNEHFFGNGDT